MTEQKPPIVHLITPYLFLTGSWVYSQLVGIQRYQSVVFTQRKENLSLFPLDNVHSPEDFNFLKRTSNLVYRRLSDQYGLHFGGLARKINPVLFHGHMGFEAVRWLRFVRKIDRPMIATFYGLDVSSLSRIPEWRRRYKALFDYGSLFLAEGSHLKKQLADLGCPPEKIIVQHLGVAVDRYPNKTTEKVRRDDGIVILQVSTFREKKGIKYSLEAIARVVRENPRVEFRLIGKGDTREADAANRDDVARLGIEKHVQLLGSKNHAETIQEMLHADIFLHPSVTASDGDNEGGAPVGVIEASAIGVPVVSTFHADIPEVVIHEESGYLVPERDSEKLAERLLELIASPRKRDSFGERGRQHIREEYNISNQVQKLEQIYRRVLDGR